MRKVGQTLYSTGAGYPASGDVPGNCLQAAVASLLDLTLVEVPHFGLFADWPRAIRLWARPYGWVVRQCEPGEATTEPLVVLWGPTVRSTTAHAVVGHPDGTLVWDPHPSRAGLTAVRGFIEFVRMAS